MILKVLDKLLFGMTIGILKGQLDNLNEGLLVYDTELKTMS
jgi:hypothetical protein